MPPIDLPQVRQRVAAMVEQFADPAGVSARVRTLLQDYSDQSYRVSQKLTSSAPPNAFKTPMPVVRQIISALRKPCGADPAAALGVLERLWSAGSREERRIAAELLGSIARRIPAEALALIETWLPKIESGDTADALAHHGLAPVLLANPPAHLPNVQRWVISPHKWTRRFALAALIPLARDRQWDDVPAALDAIRPVMADADAEVRKTAAALLGDLVPKGPNEVSRFLREQAARANHNTHWIIRAVVPRLRPADQADIIKAMRT